MRQTSTRFPAGARHAIAGAALLALVLWLTGGSPASAAGPGHYNPPVVTQDPTFTVLLTGNLLAPISQPPNGGVLSYLSTTGTGLHRLPFPLFLYNQKYSNIAISSSGNIQPGVTSPGGIAGSPGIMGCDFPIGTDGRPAIFPFWAPIYYDTASSRLGFPEGVFVRTTGASPHRTFTVSWQGQDIDANGQAILAQAVFQEGLQTVTFLYGSTVLNHDTMVIGIQSKQQLSWTAYAECDGTGAPPGTHLTWTHAG
jgi:hypothetical protein